MINELFKSFQKDEKLYDFEKVYREHKMEYQNKNSSTAKNDLIQKKNESNPFIIANTSKQKNDNSKMIQQINTQNNKINLEVKINKSNIFDRNDIGLKNSYINEKDKLFNKNERKESSETNLMKFTKDDYLNESNLLSNTFPISQNLNGIIQNFDSKVCVDSQQRIEDIINPNNKKLNNINQNYYSKDNKFDHFLSNLHTNPARRLESKNSHEYNPLKDQFRKMNYINSHQDEDLFDTTKLKACLIYNKKENDDNIEVRFGKNNKNKKSTTNKTIKKANFNDSKCNLIDYSNNLCIKNNNNNFDLLNKRNQSLHLLDNQDHDFTINAKIEDSFSIKTKNDKNSQNSNSIFSSEVLKLRENIKNNNNQTKEKNKNNSTNFLMEKQHIKAKNKTKSTRNTFSLTNSSNLPTNSNNNKLKKINNSYRNLFQPDMIIENDSDGSNDYEKRMNRKKNNSNLSFNNPSFSDLDDSLNFFSNSNFDMNNVYDKSKTINFYNQINIEKSRTNRELNTNNLNNNICFDFNDCFKGNHNYENFHINNKINNFCDDNFNNIHKNCNTLKERKKNSPSKENKDKGFLEGGLVKMRFKEHMMELIGMDINSFKDLRQWITKKHLCANKLLTFQILEKFFEIHRFNDSINEKKKRKQENYHVLSCKNISNGEYIFIRNLFYEDFPFELGKVYKANCTLMMERFEFDGNLTPETYNLYDIPELIR